MKSVSLPSSLQSIGQKAFGACTRLVSVVAPVSTYRIDSQAFLNCNALATASYYYNTTLGVHAFDQSGYPGGTKINVIGTVICICLYSFSIIPSLIICVYG